MKITNLSTKPLLIAEIANAHQGSVSEALALALMALDASGIDAVKFQIYTADELMVRDHPRYSHFKKQAFSRNAWLSIFDAIPSGCIGRVYCDVFGVDSANLAINIGLTKFKVHTSDISNVPLLKLINEHHPKHVLLSSGGCNGFEIAFALRHLSNAERITLMHGFQSYPTNPVDINLRRIRWLYEQFSSYADVGYQDHSDGSSKEAYTIPILAFALGASVLEKHITRDRSKKGTDYYSSLELNEFAQLSDELDRTVEIMGISDFSMSFEEQHYRNTVKKQWVAESDILANSIITSQQISLKRINSDSFPNLDYSSIIGQQTLQDIPKGTTIYSNNICHNVVACILVRSKSSRLPQKAYLPFGSHTSIGHLIQRVKQAKKINRIVLCTTKFPEDDNLCDIANAQHIDFYRGDNLDVLGRIIEAVIEPDATVIRVTGDDVMIDPYYLDSGVVHHLAAGVDYTSMKNLPNGLEAEFFSKRCLVNLHATIQSKNDTEYLTYFITRNNVHFNILDVKVPIRHQKRFRLTLDTTNDYILMRDFVHEMIQRGLEFSYSLDEVIDYFSNFPDIENCFRQNNVLAAKDVTVNTSLNFSALLHL